ncbi:SDR family oxidoreductase [Bombilactobacillus folatiphilus]|uniref:SDR family oxidoreductase n=1 Tax=Bombilactobacillus folatiphilus TaxID=2923362 RepID=A0ABY4P7U1_9LACO|nr:SDR family NAD(P)-dependent oxidoreductase [Bombilactobacillus folatiphilus]UQS81707.1 SDR family oxidoreductase [Bombilactobacillus folatiphilus]
MKWALILGATGGIGQVIARDLAAAGWSLYLHGNHQPDLLNSQIKQFQANYPQQDFVEIIADFNNLENVQKIVDNVFSLDAIIAAQGITNYQLFDQVTEKQLQSLIQVNLVAPLYLIQKLQNQLAKSAHGRILLFGSVYGAQGSAMEVVYSTTKGALSAFAKAYAREVASLGITINVLAPGAVRTKMNQMISEQDLQALTTEIPMGRMATPQDLSYWVQTILDSKAQYLTGQTLYVTGGWLE